MNTFFSHLCDMLFTTETTQILIDLISWRTSLKVMKTCRSLS